MATRLKTVPLSIAARPTGGGKVTATLPRAGALTWVHIALPFTLAGTLSAPNALGLAAIIKRIELEANNGVKMIDISGPGYHYLLRDMLGDNRDYLQWTEARNAVTASSGDLDVILPVSWNVRDEVGLFNLQNEQTTATLTIDFESDANVATGITSLTCQPDITLGLFEIPQDEKQRPAFNTVHRIVEDQISIAAAGEVKHDIPRGGIVIGQYYLLPSGFSRAQLAVQESNVIEDLTDDAHRLRYNSFAGKDPVLSGALTGFDKRLFWDFAGSDGFGQFGTQRDLLDTRALTSVFSRITALAAQTMRAVRREIVVLE